MWDCDAILLITDKWVGGITEVRWITKTICSIYFISYVDIDVNVSFIIDIGRCGISANETTLIQITIYKGKPL